MKGARVGRGSTRSTAPSGTPDGDHAPGHAGSATHDRARRHPAPTTHAAKDHGEARQRCAEGRLRNKDKYGTDAQLVALGTEFFDLLHSREELQKVVRDPDQTIDTRERSILLSSTTLKMLASAVHIVREENPTMKLRELSLRLAEIDFRPNGKLWKKSGFVSPGKRTPNGRLQEIRAAANLLAAALTADRVEA